LAAKLPLGLCGRLCYHPGMTWQEFVAIALLGVLAAVVILIIYSGITP
jgi:hypothetical protein